ncbi:hypothetical protein ACOSOMT5_P2444 [Acidiphilium sp. MT5]
MSGTIFCRACGASINASAPLCPQCGAPQAQAGWRAATPGDGIPRTFANAVQICFHKYVNIQGRAPRAEYWFFVLFSAIVQIATFMLVGVIELATHANLHILVVLVGLALFLPSTSVSMRRLHDRDMSGWWFLPIIILNGMSLFQQAVFGPMTPAFIHSPTFLPFVLVGATGGLWGIVLLVIFCLRGTVGDNRYGPENGEVTPQYRL